MDGGNNDRAGLLPVDQQASMRSQRSKKVVAPLLEGLYETASGRWTRPDKSGKWLRDEASGAWRRPEPSMRSERDKVLDKWEQREVSGKWQRDEVSGRWLRPGAPPSKQMIAAEPDQKDEEVDDGLQSTKRASVADSLQSDSARFADWYENEPLLKFRFSWKKLMSFAGPGLLMSIAYLDPGNIAGDLDAGIAGQYALIWTLFWSTVLGLYYQTLAARIGVCTQRNLARVCAEQFTAKTRYTLWIMTELAIIGSDVQEVVGSATALTILLGVPTWLGAIITILDSFLFLFIHYYGVRKLEFFFLALIATMTVMFVSNMVIAAPDYGEVARGAVIPTVPEGAWPAALGLVGAVIMPHNLYLHSALVLTRKINYRNRTEIRDGNIYNAIESAISLAISFVISTCVIATFAAFIVAHPGESDLTLESAAGALATSFGPSAKYIWAIGLLAAGQSSTMTGTYAGQFVMEGFLDFTLPVWQRVLLTRSVAIVPALGVSFLGQATLIEMDTWLNILQSVQLPFALVPLLKFASSRNILNEFAISKCQYYCASAFGVALFAMNFVLLFVQDKLAAWQYALVGVLASLYFGLIGMALLETTHPLKQLSQKQLDANAVEYGQVAVEEEAVATDAKVDIDFQPTPVRLG